MLSKVKSFTLIELLVVVAIIGILAAVGVPIFNNFISTSKYVAVSENFHRVANNSKLLLMGCDIKGSITIRANTGNPGGSNKTFICSNQNTNSIATLLVDHYHFSKFINPLTGYSATWWFGTPKGASLKDKDGYIFFDGKPTNKCVIKITSTVINPETSKKETFERSINMKGRVSQC